MSITRPPPGPTSPSKKPHKLSTGQLWTTQRTCEHDVCHQVNVGLPSPDGCCQRCLGIDPHGGRCGRRGRGGWRGGPGGRARRGRLHGRRRGAGGGAGRGGRWGGRGGERHCRVGWFNHGACSAAQRGRSVAIVSRLLAVGLWQAPACISGLRTVPGCAPEHRTAGSVTALRGHAANTALHSAATALPPRIKPSTWPCTAQPLLPDTQLIAKTGGSLAGMGLK